MGRRLLLVNILILVGIVVLARYVTNAWHNFEDTQNVASVLGNIVNEPKEVSVDAPPPPDVPQAFPDYTVIAEKDLFMPERRPAPPPTEVPVEVAPKLAKNPSLNGIYNNSGKKQALITIFEGNNPKGTSRVVAVGDDVQGYTVVDIADSTLKMRWKDRDEILIDMFDATPQQQAAVPKTRTSAAVTMITIGAAAAPVETTTTSAAPADERRGGLEVGVAGGQGTPGSPGQRGPGANTGRGNMGADTMRGGVSGAGTMGGTGSVPFTSGNRSRRTGR